MGNRVNRAHGLAAMVERKEHRVYAQRCARVWHHSRCLSLVQWREAKAVAVAQLAQEQAAIIRNRLQSQAAEHADAA